MATKRASVKRAPAKKRATKKRATKKSSNGSAKNLALEPLLGEILGEDKYRLKAAELEFQQHDTRVITAIQGELQRIIDRAKRNDPAWKKAFESRQAAITEYVSGEVETLDDGFAIKSIDCIEGTYRAIHDPEARNATA